MSQIWCYLVLSVIFGLGGSATLKKDEISNQVIGIGEEAVKNLHNGNKVSQILNQFQGTSGGKSGNKKANCPSNPNKARQNENCYYPHRSSTPLYCYYSIRVGNRADGDKKVHDQIYTKPKTQQTPYTFEIKYSQPNAENTGLINFIMIEDPQNTRSKCILEDDFVITYGGFNQSNVTIQVTTNNPEESQYEVKIFTK